MGTVFLFFSLLFFDVGLDGQFTELFIIYKVGGVGHQLGCVLYLGECTGDFFVCDAKSWF